MAEHVDLSLGELDRNISKLTGAVEQLSETIKRLDDDFVTRREWELVNVAHKGDVNNVGEKLREIDERLKWPIRAGWAAFFLFIATVAGGLILMVAR